MICKRCGANVPDGSEVCMNCGTRMREAAAPQRFCAKCGSPISGGLQFCSVCGETVNNNQKPDVAAKVMGAVNPAVDKVSGSITKLTGKKVDKRIVLLGGAVAIVLVLVLVISLLFGGRSAKATVDKFIDATYTGNIKTIMKLVPKDILEYAMEESGYDEDDLEELYEDAEDSFEDMQDWYEDYYGKDWEYSYEIEDMDDLSKKKLRDLQELYEDEFDVKVKAAKKVEVEITLEGEEEKSKNTMELTLIKVGGSWYLDIESIGSIF